MVRTDLPGKEGSTLIIKENIKYYEDAEYDTPEIQATMVTIEVKSNQIAIVATYCPSGKTQNEKYYTLLSITRRTIHCWEWSPQF